jgi:hypothetical protein
LSLALDAADTIQAQDSLEKMLVHQMAVLHYGMMGAAARMNEELDAAAPGDPNKREAANVRACRLAGAISRMSATYQQVLLTLQRKRTGGNQQVTRSKRTGKPCRAAAMPNGRCKVHGGKSTGPRTPEGLERSKRANWKHGYFSREAKAERSRVRAAILALRYLRMLGHLG